MNRLIRILILAVGLATLPLAARAEIFLLITGVAGDATAKGHEKWIRVSSLDWEAEAASTYTGGSGASVGKPMPGPINLVMPNGAWSRHFPRLIASGTSLPSIVLDAVASDGRPLYRVTAEGFFLTEYRLDSLPATPLPQDHVSGVFRKLKIEYYTVSATGAITTTFVEWDVSQGRVAASP
jgi:type VI protein secretion system component Hcp